MITAEQIQKEAEDFAMGVPDIDVDSCTAAEQYGKQIELAYIAGATRHAELNIEAIALLKEISDYLNDRHPQGSKSAIAINTISSTSLLHQKIDLFLTNKTNHERDKNKGLQ